ncbi:hypothetical protein OHT68_10105 [Streptomyces canus]|uniref:hypothetical protein n=1 Tax=Streptomyces canus TaxID=58343 RepID=UPI002E2BF57D|nr:hypothetical protein [Streptomyces canus]
MTPEENASEEPGGADGSAGQSRGQVAVAPARTTPDADADGRAGPQTGSVWDQPLPWAAPGDGDENRSTGQPTSAAQDASPSSAASPAPEAVAVREEGGDDAKGDVKDAGNESSVALWQAAAADRQQGAHSAPATTGAATVAGHAVSKWLLGVAVAAGGILAAVGAVEGLGSHPSAVSAKERPVPIVGPGKDLDEGGVPAPGPTTPGKSRPVARVETAALPHAQSDHTPPPAHTPGSTYTPQVSSRNTTLKSPVVQQSGYLSVHTSVTSPKDYWSQSSVTVTTTKKLSALKVVLHVAQTGGVANTGVWTSLGDKGTVHAARASDGGADYVVVLNEGITLDPGSYVFQFGYNHDQGTRDTVHDIWAVVTTAVGDNDAENRNGRY